MVYPTALVCSYWEDISDDDDLLDLTKAVFSCTIQQEEEQNESQEEHFTPTSANDRVEPDFLDTVFRTHFPS